jgi:putative aldouronate transport system permease protein
VDRGTGFIGDIRKNPVAYLLALPAIAYTFTYGYATLPYVLIAFQRFNFRTGIFGSDWIGLKNFEFFFGSPRAWQVTWNTVRLNFLSIVLGVVVALTLAIIVNELRSRSFQKSTQSLFLLPHFISWVVVSYVVYSLFSTRLGLANAILGSIGVEPVRWFSMPGPWVWIMPLIRVWKAAGMQSVIFLAAIAGIDQQLYEAATIDGATRLQQVFRITIPVLLPTVAILTLLAVGRMFYGDFAMVYSIIRDNGILYETTDVIDTYVFRALRKTGNPSQAMAVGLYQAIMGFIFVFGSNWIVRRRYEEGALF